MQTSAAEVTTDELALLPDAIQPERDFSDPENFINRELSWLEFNRRVLEEAQDPTQPLIERVKFLTIVSSNLDEFFEIRVAGIKQQIESETSDVGPDGMSPTETFNAIQRTRARNGRDPIRALEKRTRAGPGQERDSRSRRRGAERETRCLGAALFPGGSFPDADAARGRRESSLPAALEQEPQSARARTRASTAASRCTPSCRCRALSRA